MKRLIVAAALLLMLIPAGLCAQQSNADVLVFTYPELIGRDDVLTDGELGPRIPVYDMTLLLWVDDLEPTSLAGSSPSWAAA